MVVFQIFFVKMATNQKLFANFTADMFINLN